MKREYVVEQLSKRVSLNVLLNSRDIRRHQNAVDPDADSLVGYARWILPDSNVKIETGPEWIEAQIPDVDANQRKTFEKLSKTACWDPRSDMADLDSKIDVTKRRILAERTYLTHPWAFSQTGLDHVAVDPENQRRQIAIALVESGMEQAEKMGLPVFVVAFKIGRTSYLKLGFGEILRIIRDDSAFGRSGDYGAYFMVYDVSRRDQ